MDPGRAQPPTRTYVAFIRAINVAGHARVKMNDVKRAFASAGCEDVRTYIQSGNVLFRAHRAKAEPLFRRIRDELSRSLGHEPTVMFRKLEDVHRIVRADPFRRFRADADAKLYVTFLSRRPTSEPRLPLRSPKEGLVLVGAEALEVFVLSRRKENGFYGFPNAFVEKAFGVPATSRNWSTVARIAELGDASR